MPWSIAAPHMVIPRRPPRLPDFVHHIPPSPIIGNRRPPRFANQFTHTRLPYPLLPAEVDFFKCHPPAAGAPHLEKGPPCRNPGTRPAQVTYDGDGVPCTPCRHRTPPTHYSPPRLDFCRPASPAPGGDHHSVPQPLAGYGYAFLLTHHRIRYPCRVPSPGRGLIREPASYAVIPSVGDVDCHRQTSTALNRKSGSESDFAANDL